MLNQYAVDIPTLPVNLCLSHLIQFLKECKAVLLECRAAEKGRQAFGTRRVYRETFLQIQLRLLQHLIRRNWIHGVQAYRNRFTHQQRRRMRIKHQFKIRAVLWECRAAKYLEHARYIGKRFCKSRCAILSFSTGVFFITLSRTRVQSVDLRHVRTHITACSE